MLNLVTNLYHDEAGFIVSAELILVSTIVVLGCLVGLSEVSHGINEELEDVGSAFGSVNQGFKFSGFTGAKGKIVGSRFFDFKDECDGQCDITCDGGSEPESRGHHHHRRDY
jgi:hypothetical protein